MDRRTFLASSAALAGLALARGTAAAETDPHAGHGASHGVGAAHDPALAKLADAASECLVKAESCVPHCIRLIEEGDTTLTECLASVIRLRAAVGAMASVAAFDAKPTDSTRALAAACAKFCRECEEACKPHYEKHVSCKECGESCGRCAKACDAVAAA